MSWHTSIAMTSEVDAELRNHLVRADGQEDICLATYRLSTGTIRKTALLRKAILPETGEREVHGNASLTGDYVIRGAMVAQSNDEGLVLCHSHPGGKTWQSMSGPDKDAESSFANLVREMTGMPLVGMTIAGGDGSWSGRHWDHGLGDHVQTTECDNVRVLGDRLVITWNNATTAIPIHSSQKTSASCWGPKLHNDLVRRKVLVVGVGSVGLDIALRLAATGFVELGLMDFDTIEYGNLDRLIGVTATDAWLHRSKVEVARRLVMENSTATSPRVVALESSICESEGLKAALDFDIVICCVDRPWPRAVLNTMAYSSLIPVIDGGIAVDVFPDDGGMRNATWRSHVVRPGRPCMSCNGQLDLGSVAADVQGLLDDPTYIAGTPLQPRNTGQNVALLSMSAAAGLLAQFVSLNVAPGGIGEPGPLQYILSTHTLEHLAVSTRPGCPIEGLVGYGDPSPDLTGHHPMAHDRRQERMEASRFPGIRLGRVVDDFIWKGRSALKRRGCHQSG